MNNYKQQEKDDFISQQKNNMSKFHNIKIIPYNLQSRKKSILRQMLRVDHAGEFAAMYIYAGQLKWKHSEEIQNMKNEEVVHYRYFDEKIKEYKVRPSALLVIWKFMAFFLGFVTSALGDKTAMACTIAVEEVIDKHYIKQLEELKKYPDLASIKEKIDIFRQEELDHRDTGIENHGHDAFGYSLLSIIIKNGCKIAIELSKHI